MSLLGTKTKSAILSVFNRVLVAGWESTWVLLALLSNKLQVTQMSARTLQLQLQLHPCCIKEEDRIIISQWFIFINSTGMLDSEMKIHKNIGEI